MHVVLMGRQRDQLEETASGIDGHAAVCVGDVRDAGDVSAALELAGEYGGVDVLINNAGVMPIAPMLEASIEDWQETLEVNVLGALRMISAALVGMCDRGRGHIVNISSVAGRTPFPSAAVYSASKSALDALSEGLRAELAKLSVDGPSIRVTSIAPGAVATDLAASIRHDSTREATEAYYQRFAHPLQSDDIAEAVSWAVHAPPHVSVSEIVIRPTEMVR